MYTYAPTPHLRFSELKSRHMKSSFNADIFAFFWYSCIHTSCAVSFLGTRTIKFLVLPGNFKYKAFLVTIGTILLTSSGVKIFFSFLYSTSSLGFPLTLTTSKGQCFIPLWMVAISLLASTIVLLGLMATWFFYR